MQRFLQRRILIGAFLMLGAATARAEDLTGQAIYLSQCARCHGESGQGTDEHYSLPLVGDQSVGQLASLISDTMPADEDEKCAPAEALKVAEYIYNAFYSPEAQFRDKPARVELSRLTITQHQSAVADLIGSFRPSAIRSDEHGLIGKYFAARIFRPEAKKFDRVDAEVNFDFGAGPPVNEGFDPNVFSIVWEGSVLAPDTGDYEFIVRTENACRLFVNHLQSPLFDNWVKSGNDTEYRGKIRLLGGRAYPLRLEFSKARQGVGDSQQPKDDAKANSSIVLQWQRPHHTPEVIPARYLLTSSGPEVFVLRAPFPPDDRSVGYERGTAISKAWDDATTEAALEVAEYVAEHINELAQVKDNSHQRDAYLIDFCHTFAERAFRRPLTDQQRLNYVDRQFAEAIDLTRAVKQVVLLVMKSPRFLYREIPDDDAIDGYDIASRMSFGLWDSIPDQTLLNQASTNRLTDRGQVVWQLGRMLEDPRTQSKLRQFFLTWLRVNDPPSVSKDPALFPQFTPETLSDLRTSLELSIEEMLASGSADFREMMLGDSIYLNGPLAAIYGVSLPEDAAFTKVQCQPEARAGLVSHPYLLSCFAYADQTSPIHRGVFISRSLLGRSLRQPPEAVAPLPVELHADLTTRERVALQTEPPTCQSCHQMINPLGFSLEEFDAIGRFRTAEKNQPINAAGSYTSQAGQIVHFDGATQLAAFLAESQESQASFTQQLFHNLVKQPIRAYGPDCWHELRDSFAAHNFDIYRLAVEIVATSAMHSENRGNSPEEHER